MNKSEHWSGSLMAMLVVMMWSGFILISRSGALQGLNAWDIMAIRYSTAACLVAPVWLMRSGMSLFTPRMLALGLSGGLGYALFTFTGFTLAPAAHAGVLLPGLMPFEIALLAWLILGHRLSLPHLLGLLAIAPGLVALAIDSYERFGHLNPGSLFFVGGSLCWALYSVLARRWSVTPWEGTFAVVLLTSLAFLPVYFLLLPKQIATATPTQILTQAIYQGVIAQVVQMLVYVRTLAIIGPQRLGSWMALIPAIAGIAAVPVLQEPLSEGVVIGLFCVSLGAWLGNRSNTQPSQAANHSLR